MQMTRTCLTVACLTIACLLNGSRAQPPYAERTPLQWRETLASSEFAVLRRRAAYVLGRLPAAARDSVPPLIKALKDRDLVVRWYAADSLGRLRAAAASATPALIAGLSDPTNDKDVRRNIAKALGRIGKPAAAAADALRAALSNDDRLYRIEAAVALYRISEAAEATKSLAELLAEADDRIAYAALRAFDRLDGPLPDVQAVARQLARKSGDTRRAAARLLRRYHTTAVDPVLAAIRQTAAFPVVCLNALRLLADEPKPLARPHLERLADAALDHLNHADETVRRSATALLARTGDAAAVRVVKRWQEEPPAWRTRARAALEDWLRRLPPVEKRTSALQPLRGEIGGALIALLRRPEPESRKVSLMLLAELGPPADLKMSLNAIRAALRDPDVVNRRNAARLLRSLEKPP